jgi:hypothetical protein
MSVKRAFFGIFQKLVVFCCAIFFGFANAFSANLPSGYTELEYIQSSGTQYIDTDIYVDFAKNFKVNGRFYNPDASKRKIILGNYSGSGVLNIELKADPAYFRTYFTASTTVDAASNVAMPVNELVSYNVNYDAVSHKSTTIVNGSSFVADIPASSAVASNPLRFFLDWRNPNTVIANPIGIGKTEIYKADALVGDFVPAKNSSGVVGMFDTVGNRFYTNAGTGTFTAGPVVGIRIATTTYNNAQFNPVVNDLNTTIATIRDVVTNTINQTKAIADLQAKKQTRPDEQCPAGKKCLLVEDNDGTPHWYEIIENVYGLPAGYTPLEYIQSDGASYLIVPYRVNNKTVFYCRYNTPQNTLSAAVIFGVTNEPSVSQANNGILRLIGSGYNRMGWGNSASGSTINVNAPKEFNTWYEVLYDQNKLYQNNTLYATSATQPSTSWTANYDLGIFARNGSSVTYASEAKISSVWAKENGEYKINLVPAKRNSDNVIGMYDLVNDVFYTNSGTGTFTGKEF